MPFKFDKLCNDLRSEITLIGISTKELLDHSDFQLKEAYGGMHGEMRANVMLAYRHLEDARMRLGKAIQAFDGGTSVYDKAKP